MENDRVIVAIELGSSKIFNVAILGVALGTGKTGLKKEHVVAEIKERVKERFVELNLRALEKGESLAN